MTSSAQVRGPLKKVFRTYCHQRGRVDVTTTLCVITAVYVVIGSHYVYFARGSGCEVLWWVCLSVCLCVCLSASIGLSPEPYARFLPNFCARCLCRDLVLFRHVYDRPHRILAGKGFSSPLKMHYRSGKGMGVHSAGCLLLWFIIFLFFAL